MSFCILNIPDSVTNIQIEEELKEWFSSFSLSRNGDKINLELSVDDQKKLNEERPQLCLDGEIFEIVQTSQAVTVLIHAICSGEFEQELIKKRIEDLVKEKISSQRIDFTLELSLTEKAASTLIKLKRRKMEGVTVEFVKPYRSFEEELLVKSARNTITGKRLIEEGSDKLPYYEMRQVTKLTGNILKILVIGQTGCGKSTLINAMANYIARVCFNEPLRYKIVLEGLAGQGCSTSVTKEVTKYNIPDHGLGYAVEIYDTPGFGDTDGPLVDQQHRVAIRNKLLEMDELHAICVVFKSSATRLTATESYIIDQVLTLFGKDAIENIFVLITFADAAEPPVLKILQSSQFPFNRYYRFNNSALWSESFDDIVVSQYWNLGETSLKSFFDCVKRIVPAGLHNTKDVLRERMRLENKIAALQPQVSENLKSIADIKNQEQEINKHRLKIDQHKQYTMKRKVPKTTRIDLSGKGVFTTNCLKCNYTCHADCAYSNDCDKKNCCAITNDFCTVCPSKCHWSNHANLPYRYVLGEEEVIEVHDETKKQHDLAQNQCSLSQKLLNQLKNEYCKMQQNMKTLISDISSALTRLNEIAARPTSMNTLDYLDFLIDNEKQAAKPGWKDRVAAYNSLKQQEQILLQIANAKSTDDVSFTNI